MVDIKDVWEFLKGKSDTERARISAYVLAPGLLLITTVSGVFGSGSRADVDKPFAISELRSEIGDGMESSTKSGIILIADAMDSEYRIELETKKPTIWSSLTQEQVRANAQHLTLDDSGLNAKTPFVGVSEPAAVVIEGVLGKSVHLPGRTLPINEWLISSRRSSSIPSSVLLACVFAFGMSIATGIPTAASDEKTASEVSG
jgi:hypothetical protein